MDRLATASALLVSWACLWRSPTRGRVFIVLVLTGKQRYRPLEMQPAIAPSTTQSRVTVRWWWCRNEFAEDLNICVHYPTAYNEPDRWEVTWFNYNVDLS